MKKLLIMLTVLTITVAAIPVFAYESPDIIINGETVTIPEEYGRVIITNERTMVPIRFITETLGFAVEWEEEDQTIMCADNANIIMLQIGWNRMFINNDTVELDTPPFLENGRTYIPLRVLAENIGYTVGWNEETGTVSLTK